MVAKLGTLSGDFPQHAFSSEFFFLTNFMIDKRAVIAIMKLVLIN